MDNNMLNTINAILQEWADNFGTTMEQLVPEMQKYYIVKYSATVIAWLVVFVAMLVIGKYLIRKHNELGEEDYEDLNIWGRAVWVLSVLPFSIICYFVTVLFQWIVSPSASLINVIINTLGNR